MNAVLADIAWRLGGYASEWARAHYHDDGYTGQVQFHSERGTIHLTLQNPEREQLHAWRPAGEWGKASNPRQWIEAWCAELARQPFHPLDLP